MLKLNLMEEDKIFSVSISGNIEQDHLDNFIKKLKFTICNIDTKNYNLLVEAKSVKVKSIRGLLTLSQIMNIYKKTDFKRIFAMADDDIKSMKQAELIRRFVGKDIIIVDSLDEVKENLA